MILVVVGYYFSGLSEISIPFLQCLFIEILEYGTLFSLSLFTRLFLADYLLFIIDNTICKGEFEINSFCTVYYVDFQWLQEYETTFRLLVRQNS